LPFYPVIYDDHDQAMIMKSLLGGAMRCLLKPLTTSDVKSLWQIAFSKQRRVMAKSRQGNLEATRREVAQGIPRNDPLMREEYQKRKADELERTNCWFIGESSSAARTLDVKHKLLKVEGLSRFYSAPLVVARRNYALGTTSNALLVEKQQCKSESTDALSDTASSSLPKEGSLLKRYLENHHSREQLRRLIVVSYRKWDVVPKALSVTPPPPSPPSDVPPISVPLALAAYIENFIHTTMAVARAPPGFVHEVASNMASSGPSVLAEFQGCNEELEPGLLEELDTDELFEAIEEFRD
ncbi:hypothetical protein KSS87_010404, partial [Heliosperma pusillum]